MDHSLLNKSLDVFLSHQLLFLQFKTNQLLCYTKGNQQITELEEPAKSGLILSVGLYSFFPWSVSFRFLIHLKSETQHRHASFTKASKWLHPIPHLTHQKSRSKCNYCTLKVQHWKRPQQVPCTMEHVFKNALFHQFFFAKNDKEGFC